MWEYICPACRKEVKRNSHDCPHCGERFPLTIRVPPRFLKDSKKLEAYVHKHIFPRVSEFERNYLTKYFTVLFSDGQVGSTQETAHDFSAWTGTTVAGDGAISVAAENPHHGDDSFKIVAPNTDQYHTAYASKTLTAQAQMNARAYVRTTAFNNLKFSGGFYIVGGTYVRLQVNFWQTSGVKQWNILYRNTTSSYIEYVNDANLAVDTYFCLELEVIAGASGSYRVLVDGVEIWSKTAQNMSTDQPNQIRLGIIDSVNRVVTFNGDCVVVADAYIGPEAAAGQQLFTLINQEDY